MLAQEGLTEDGFKEAGKEVRDDLKNTRCSNVKEQNDKTYGGNEHEQ